MPLRELSCPTHPKVQQPRACHAEGRGFPTVDCFRVRGRAEAAALGALRILPAQPGSGRLSSGAFYEDLSFFGI